MKYLVLTLVVFLSVCLSAQTRQDTTLLDTSYGMVQDAKYHYSGKDPILDNIRGLLKWQRFSKWKELEDDSSSYVASLCIYFDSLYPNVEVMRKVAVKADDLFFEMFVKSNAFENADTTVRLGPSFYSTPNSVLNYFGRRFAVFNKKYKANLDYHPLPDFRVVVIACRQYHKNDLSTYMIQGSFDWNGSNGCCTSSEYYTYDNKGRRLKYYDIFRPNTKSEVLKLLKKQYKLQSRDGFTDYKWTTNDIGNNLALVKEGVLFYYVPYSIGCGAEGQYNLILKYQDIANLLK